MDSEDPKKAPNLLVALFAPIAVAFGMMIVALLRSVVPLAIGLIGGCIAGALYAGFLSDANIGPFFSSVTGVGVGVLIALMINSLEAGPDWMEWQGWMRWEGPMRAGVVGLVAIALFSALVGQLVTGSALVRGILFGLTWGGMTSGVVALFFSLATQKIRRELDTPESLAQVYRPPPDKS